MGLVNFGVPEDLVLLLRDGFGIQDFVEAGTYLGETAAWAAGQFPRVTTIEASAVMHRAAQGRHGSLPNVQFELGDTRQVLRRLLPALHRPALFWLDSHWSGGPTFGEGDECPLLEELALLAQAPCEHFVLIDDARLFAATPPAPHRPEQWPGLPEVFDGLRADGRSPFIVYIEDVIVSVPAAAAAVVRAYCRVIADRDQKRRDAR